MKISDPCPCDRAQTYGGCCGRWHQGEPAPDAVNLMRARYSAWVLGLGDFLQDTWHPPTRPTVLEMPPADLRWLGLEVRSHEPSTTDNANPADTATVSFVARSKQAGRANRLHETSRFLREAGRWLYVDGDIHPR